MFSLDPDCTDLCLIDSGIKSLDKVPLRQNLQSINLHSNYIQKVENLSHLCKLRHLDLSSNQISVIEGLDGLQSLRTINLSCNYLKDLRGLAGLRSLVKLNVSYNQINDISGLKSLHGPDYKLSQLELHGNQLSSWKHVLQCLIGCKNLRQLTLCWDGSSNPICDTRDYRAKLLSALTQLETLDNVNRQGVLVSGTQVIADIPGLEEYMDYLISNTTSSMSMESSVDKLMDIVTPKIDQAIENFRHRHVASSTETSMAAGSEADTSIGQKSEQVSSEPEKKQTYSDQEKRLELLEKQLAELMKVSKSQLGSRDKNEATVQHLEAERDRTDDSEDSTASRGKSPGRRKRRSRIPGYRKSTASSRARKEASTPPPETSSSAGVKDDGDLTFEFDKNNVTKARGPSAVMIDEQKREDVQSTYLQIMKELESERERRWKAEKASRKLLDHIKELQGKATQGDQLKDTALEATNRLKQALMNEREAKLRLQDDVERLKEHIKELNRQLGVAKDSEESYKRSLRSMEEVTAKMERDGIQQQTHEQKKAQDAQMRAAALNRELELIRATSEKQKGQITQLQELLANREQQHREELKNRYSLDSKELKEVLDEHAQKKDREYRLEMKAQQERIETLTKQYTELEDEFRMALQIEANRFRELEVAYEKLVDENKQSKQSLLAAHGKDEETTSIVTELTALVKEQKGRISELSKAKSEQSLEYRERIQTLEAHVEEAKKRMLQMELLKQDKTKLLAQVEAQESVISGLKAERKLWGQELAQQGASLAQDRGRLESKIEAQTSEITTMKKNFERETDALKIKTKMLEDQTETIRKMKEALVDRDEEIKKAREESLKIQKNLEEQLNEERANIQDNQETIEHLRERKQELKQQLSDITAELDDSKKAHGILNNKWKEKSHLIGQLETQVQEMKENWEGKERKLTEERNKAVEAANIAIEKLRNIDDAFRSQLETKEQKHQEEMGMLERDKQLEIDQANRRVFEVEEEMRELLKENEANKRTMEDKVKRLTQAMADIQSDLL